MPRDKQYTLEELKKGWNEYLSYCQNFKISMLNTKGGITDVPKPRIPTVGGFCNYIKLTTEALENYEHTEGYEEFFGTVKEIKDFIKGYKVDSLVNGEGNTTGLIFDLKVNYGMNEKTVIDANITGLPVNIITTNTPPLANDDK